MTLISALRPAFAGFALLLSLLSGAVHAQVSLTLGDATLNPGDSGSITASIATDGSAVALQFDVLYDPGVLSFGTVSGGPALTGNHSIASNPISPGRDRVVITTAPVTAPVTALGAGVLATINLAVLGSAGSGTTSLNWAGVVISDASAQPITPTSLTPDSPRAQTLPGDANGDGRVDAEDVRLIVERILERGVLPGDGDCNRDSTINVLDTVCSQIPFVPGETAPIILGPGDRSIPADIAFEMNLFAANPDAGSTQSWILLSGPAGLAVSPAGVLIWTPPGSAAGPNPVAIRVTDDTARTDEATFSIDVTLPHLRRAAEIFPRYREADSIYRRVTAGSLARAEILTAESDAERSRATARLEEVVVALGEDAGQRRSRFSAQFAQWLAEEKPRDERPAK